MENVWQFMRDNWLSNRIFKSYEDIVALCCQASNNLIDQPWACPSACAYDRWYEPRTGFAWPLIKDSPKCFFGEGMPRNAEQSVYWYRMAAEQGYANAELDLGVAYETGIGVPSDSGKPRIGLAAAQGNADAQRFLGNLYSLGHGVPQDYVQAHKWLTLGASGVLGADRIAVIGFRDEIEKFMTAEQITEAWRLTTKWTVGDQ